MFRAVEISGKLGEVTSEVGERHGWRSLKRLLIARRANRAALVEVVLW
jgi:hypothetical protein